MSNQNKLIGTLKEVEKIQTKVNQRSKRGLDEMLSITEATIVESKVDDRNEVNRSKRAKTSTLRTMPANAAITLTMGDRAENHRGMEIIGKAAEKGFVYEDLKSVLTFFERELNVKNGRIISIHDELKPSIKRSEVNSLPDAYILVIPGGIKHLVDYALLVDEMLSVTWDEKALMYGRVVQKKARKNLIFSDTAQSADYAKGKGTIISYEQVPELKKLRDRIMMELLTARDSTTSEAATSTVKDAESGAAAESEVLEVEGNYYYDLQKCGIGYHGDTERKKVVGIRIGEGFPLCYQWFQESKPLTDRLQLNLGEGDLYMMSEKAVGFDWKTKKIPTLRHAAGCNAFTIYKSK